MTDAPLPPAADDFFATAGRLGLVPAADLTELRQECSRSGMTPPQFLVDRRRLDAIAVDIVETVLAPEAMIPGYRVEDLLGRGGMGVVYRAVQLNLNRTVALKTILVSRMSDAATLDRFEQEARLIGKLRHPNIIAAHDFGRHSGRLFLAMELVEGIDLDRSLARSGPLEESVAWGLARQTASGLAHAARHDVVHRDIKPANLVLVDPPEGYPLPPGMPMVKIADFGLALLTANVAVQTRLTAESTTLGSPHYMAPEQFQSSTVDIRADMYALGATVYHALVGQAPFAGLNLSQLIAAKLNGSPPPLSQAAPHVQPATCRLVERLMARSPADRPASYTELLTEIDGVVRPFDTTLVSMPSTPSVAPAPAGRHATQSVELDETVTALPAQPRTHPAIPWRLLGAVVAGVAVLGWVGFYFRPAAPVPLPTTRAATRTVGYSQLLFNGENMAGWTRRSGGWSVPPGGAVLAGANGLIERVLFVRGNGSAGSGSAGSGSRGDTAPARPLQSYRLEILLPPPQAAANGVTAAQEVHFGLVTTPDRDGPRYVLRATAERVEIGSREGDQGDFVPDPRLPPTRRRSDRPVGLAIERLSNGWFISIDERQVASLPLHPGGELPEFRLAVTEGTAHFSDIMVTELQPIEE